MTTAIVSGAIANKPWNGGAAWTRLSWVLGLQRLGFRVHFVEQIARERCFGEHGAVVPFHLSRNLAYFRTVMAQFNLTSSATLVLDDGEQTVGLPYEELTRLADDSTLLINISGHLTFDALKRGIARKVYVDLDPGFTQLWAASGTGGARLDGHDFYFTVGENIGTAACTIPTGGLSWHPVRQPVVLDLWPPCAASESRRFTTVATWRGPYGRVEYGGRQYGLKVHEFRKFIQLPNRVDAQFELALNIHEAEADDRRTLADHGWQVVDPEILAGDPESFRRYVQGSAAEFSTAQGIYVETNSGWFSDRTVRYLASGKPVLVQDTGFSRNLPTGEGLVAFRTLGEAIAGAENILRDYDKHREAARRLAETYFDSSKVLAGLIDMIGCDQSARSACSRR